MEWLVDRMNDCECSSINLIFQSSVSNYSQMLTSDCLCSAKRRCQFKLSLVWTPPFFLFIFLLFTLFFAISSAMEWKSITTHTLKIKPISVQLQPSRVFFANSVLHQGFIQDFSLGMGDSVCTPPHPLLPILLLMHMPLYVSIYFTQINVWSNMYDFIIILLIET